MKTHLTELELIQQERLRDTHFKILIVHLMYHYHCITLGSLISKWMFPTLKA